MMRLKIHKSIIKSGTMGFLSNILSGKKSENTDIPVKSESPNERVMNEYIEAVRSYDIDKVTRYLNKYNNLIDLPIWEVHGQTLLHIGIINNRIDIVNLAIKMGANLNIKDSFNKTPLARAIEKNNEEISRILIEAGADINIPDNIENTPLDLAISSGSANIIDMLLKKGANPNGTDKSGAGTFYNAISSGRLDIIDMLVRAGANTKYINPIGRTYLIQASLLRYEAVVDYFIKCGLNLNAKDNSGSTALMYSSGIGDKNIVELLLINRANPDLQDENGYTALMFASLWGRADVVDKLMIAGAKIDIKNKYGNTALFFAECNEHGATVEILKTASGKISSEHDVAIKPEVISAGTNEDPEVYSTRFIGLRKIIRSQNGEIPCIRCHKPVIINFGKIKRKIQKNQKFQDKFIDEGSPDKGIYFKPGKDEPRVCPTCKGVLCSSCKEIAKFHEKYHKERLLKVLKHYNPEIALLGQDSQKKALEIALEDRDYTILCNICKEDLLGGIDHITD